MPSTTLSPRRFSSTGATLMTRMLVTICASAGKVSTFIRTTVSATVAPIWQNRRVVMVSMGSRWREADGGKPFSYTAVSRTRRSGRPMKARDVWINRRQPPPRCNRWNLSSTPEGRFSQSLSRRPPRHDTLRSGCRRRSQNTTGGTSTSDSHTSDLLLMLGLSAPRGASHIRYQNKHYSISRYGAQRPQHAVAQAAIRGP